MSLSAALNIGRSALSASQLGIQVASNNMANASTPGYSRQRAIIESIAGDRSIGGGGAGRGVRVGVVRRDVDAAINSRLTAAGADAAAATVQERIFRQLETTLGELGDNDLSNELSGFFKVWSERANETKSSSAVIQQADRMARFCRKLRGDLTDQRAQIDDSVAVTVDRANQLITNIAELNKVISTSESGGSPANSLRDQREQAIDELATLVDVSVIDRGLGGFDVMVGSAPVVLGDRSKQLEVSKTSTPDGTRLIVQTAGDDSQQLDIRAGELGSLLVNRTGALETTITRLDRLVSQMVFEVNRLHSTGTNASGLRSSSGTAAFSVENRGRALNDPANDVTNLQPYKASNGGFMVNVRDRATGGMQTVRVAVDLDGIDATGTPGTGDDTSAEDIRAALAAIPGLSAEFGVDGKLRVTAAEGFDFSFSDDTSGALAVLGMNAFFTGGDASDVAVNAELVADSSKLLTGRMVNGSFVENGTALELARLQGRASEGLGGLTFAEHWRDTSQMVGGGAAEASINASARAMVRDSLQSQRDAISGVNIDEESIGLLDFQRQYQAAARVISTVDQMTQTLLAML
ncbi:MAG: flagellar hook-associated protein FlgK [Phycisphaerae bacterium]|jgi:flagellar hook-associated protein 1 FlgK